VAAVSLSKAIWVIDVLSLGDLTDKAALWMPEEIIDVFQRADTRRAADPDRRPFFPTHLTEEDAGTLPRVTDLAAKWEELKGRYDIVEQLEGVVDGLLGKRRITEG
jgi:hypothetical protein